MNETLRTIDSRAVLRMERRLAHPPEKVWRVLTEPAHLNQWYPFPAVEIDLRVGGTIRFDDGQGTTSEATITACDPPRVFAFSEDAGKLIEGEGENLLHFELRPEADGCLLVLTHTFHDRTRASATAAGWQYCLDALETSLEGGQVPGPESFVETHESYVKRFGLDEGTAWDTPDGWRVRFERIVMQPIEQVWSALRATEDVPGGPDTVSNEPTLLEYDRQPSGGSPGRVRWELSTDPAGTRLMLTQTGTGEPEARADAMATWRLRVEELVRKVYEQGG